MPLFSPVLLIELQQTCFRGIEDVDAGVVCRTAEGSRLRICLRRPLSGRFGLRVEGDAS